MTTRVSIVIPAHRAAATIERTVASVLAQQLPGLRILVVVDGRDDETCRILDRYRDRGVDYLVNETNQGSQFSRNRGLAAIEGDYVMFLDSDDFHEGPLLSGLMHRMEAAGADIGFAPMRRRNDRTGRILLERRPDDRSADDLFMRWFGHSEFIAPCAILWKSAFVRGIGGWDPEVRKSQDIEIVLRAILGGARFTCSDEGAGVYVFHGDRPTITSRTDNFVSLFDVNEKLLALPSTAVSAEVRRRAGGMRYYNVAKSSFAAGQEELGERALKRSRELGFAGHRGTLRHRLLASLLGLRRKAALVTYVRRRFGLAR